MESVSLSQIVEDFADGLKAVDQTGISHKSFAPGIGPFGEADSVRLAVDHLKAARKGFYDDAQIKRTPDLLLPGRWALEFKLIRPFGDNGQSAEHWSENVLHPYAGNTSSIGDCLKLLSYSINCRKAVVIFGFEHTPPKVLLEPALQGFELLARSLVGIQLGRRVLATRNGLIHPYHQQLIVCAFEVFGRVSDDPD